MPRCPDCKSNFPGGERAGHCSACCRTFIGLTAFEAHRTGKHGTTDRRCELTEQHWEDERGFIHYGDRGYWKSDADPD